MNKIIRYLKSINKNTNIIIKQSTVSKNYLIIKESGEESTNIGFNINFSESGLEHTCSMFEISMDIIVDKITKITTDINFYLNLTIKQRNELILLILLYNLDINLNKDVKCLITNVNKGTFEEDLLKSIPKFTKVYTYTGNQGIVNTYMYGGRSSKN